LSIKRQKLSQTRKISKKPIKLKFRIFAQLIGCLSINITLINRLVDQLFFLGKLPQTEAVLFKDSIATAFIQQDDPPSSPVQLRKTGAYF